VQDGILFEKRGMPAASIATHEFVNMGRASAAAQGLPDYPFVIMEHPIGRLEDAELRHRAEAVLEDVVRLLLDSPA
jgi:hypothetical protein